MRTFPFSLAEGALALAYLVHITRRDGTEYRFCTAQSDVTLGGHTYKAEPGVEISSIQFRNDGAVSNAQINIATRSGGLIPAADIAAGLFGGAALKIYLARLG